MMAKCYADDSTLEKMREMVKPYLSIQSLQCQITTVGVDGFKPGKTPTWVLQSKMKSDGTFWHSSSFKTASDLEEVECAFDGSKFYNLETGRGGLLTVQNQVPSSVPSLLMDDYFAKYIDFLYPSAYRQNAQYFNFAALLSPKVVPSAIIGKGTVVLGSVAYNYVDFRGGVDEWRNVPINYRVLFNASFPVQVPAGWIKSETDGNVLEVFSVKEITAVAVGNGLSLYLPKTAQTTYYNPGECKLNGFDPKAPGTFTYKTTLDFVKVNEDLGDMSVDPMRADLIWDVNKKESIRVPR